MTVTTHPLQVLVHPDRATLAAAAGARLLLALQQAQGRAGPALRDAHLVLTGGSMGSAILAAAGASPLLALVDWSRVHFWWGDERYLPTGHPDRNETQNRVALLDRLTGLDPARVHSIPGPDGSADPEDAATRYAAELAAHAPRPAFVPDFDILLLGVGPDAHICSLFPGRPELGITHAPTAPVDDSPKPPTRRVTLTFPALARARHTWLLVAGTDKAAAVQRSCDASVADQTPAGRVHGREETLWLVDAAAAALLPIG